MHLFYNILNNTINTINTLNNINNTINSIICYCNFSSLVVYSHFKNANI